MSLESKPRRCRRCRRTGNVCMDLDQFLAAPTREQSQYICQPRFERFYVRKWLWAPTRAAEIRRTIVLANIRAEKPGAGAFKDLIAQICARYPRYYVLAECVTPRLVAGLLRMGFQAVYDMERCYWLPIPD